MAQNPLLFLDFDGVLHPISSASYEPFVHMLRFEQVMRDHAEVDIVISSGWQDGYSIRQLRPLFSPGIGARIIGGTLSADPRRKADTRYRQILKFLSKVGRMGPWVALDDAAKEFPINCPHLVLCDSTKGFDEEAETRLRLELLAIRRHTSAV
jgi:hypothetical protein